MLLSYYATAATVGAIRSNELSKNWRLHPFLKSAVLASLTKGRSWSISVVHASSFPISNATWARLLYVAMRSNSTCGDGEGGNDAALVVVVVLFSCGLSCPPFTLHRCKSNRDFDSSYRSCALWIISRCCDASMRPIM